MNNFPRKRRREKSESIVKGGLKEPYFFSEGISFPLLMSNREADGTVLEEKKEKLPTPPGEGPPPLLQKVTFVQEEKKIS